MLLYNSILNVWLKSQVGQPEHKYLCHYYISDIKNDVKVQR